MKLVNTDDLNAQMSLDEMVTKSVLRFKPMVKKVNIISIE